MSGRITINDRETNMGKSKKDKNVEIGYAADADRDDPISASDFIKEDEAEAEHTASPSATMRVEIDVDVNGITAGQVLTVDVDNKFYSGLVQQGLAHVLKDED